jgi:hypothetical protein
MPLHLDLRPKIKDRLELDQELDTQGQLSRPILDPTEERSQDLKALEWDYENQENESEADKTDKSIWLQVLLAFMKFALSLALAFLFLFVTALFMVGDFYDPIPSSVEAIKASGVLAVVATTYAIFLLFKRRYSTAFGLFFGSLLAVGLFYAGYLFYKNGQTLPLLETFLGWLKL